MRTWAPKGQTPIIQFHFNWTHVSVIAGLTRTNCLFRLHEGSIKKEELVDFLKALKAHRVRKGQLERKVRQVVRVRLVLKVM